MADVCEASVSSVYSVDSPKFRDNSCLFVVPNQLFPNKFFPAGIEFQLDDGALVLHRLNGQATDMEAFLSRQPQHRHVFDGRRQLRSCVQQNGGFRRHSDGIQCVTATI